MIEVYYALGSEYVPEESKKRCWWDGDHWIRELKYAELFTSLERAKWVLNHIHSRKSKPADDLAKVFVIHMVAEPFYDKIPPYQKLPETQEAPTRPSS